MSRNFSQPRAGKFCIQIPKYELGEFKLHYELLNLKNNQLEGRNILQKNKKMNLVIIEFGLLQAGNYQITLKNVSTDILPVEQCSGMVHFITILRTKIKFLSQVIILMWI
jgi:hypothetical protein